MNFDTLEADVNMLVPVHYTSGRGGNQIEYIGIHYNAGDLTVEGCYNVWLTREASAHYQVESNGTACLGRQHSMGSRQFLCEPEVY